MDAILLIIGIAYGVSGISYNFDQKPVMFWKLANSFKMMK
jgi:hypothetical protein